MKKILGSEALIKSLLVEGVDTIFGYPGGAFMPIYDPLYSYQDKINHILTRHEQGAIHAAQGYSRVSGKVGVCFATSGPGATNLITGIADAQIDSTPLVCITGQVPSQLLGTDAFQESDVIGISMPVTKWNYQITSSDEIGEIISKAFYIARSGRPGPVLIDITKDAQFSEVDFNYKKCERIRSYHPYPIINDKKIKKASKLINKAKKPLILVGQGVLLSNAENELIKFSEITRIPELRDLIFILSIGFGVTGLSHLLSDVISNFILVNFSYLEKYSLTSNFFWLVIFSTSIGVALSFTRLRKLEGAGSSKMGSIFIYILVLTIGLKMDLLAIFQNPGLFLLGFIWIGFHVTLLIIVAKLIRAPFFFVAVGSQANVGGAASAPVVAAAFHPSLAAVGVLLAVLGYAVGTYAAYICGIIMQNLV